MVLLDVICLVVALVAIAFAVVALLRARGADDRAAAAASAIARAEANAQAAAAGLEQLETRVAQARQDAAQSAQHSARAAQAAAQASASAAAARREAEVASDKAVRAEAETARTEESVRAAESAWAEQAARAADTSRTVQSAGAQDTSAAEYAESGVEEPSLVSAGGSAGSTALPAGRATVQRAEDHDVPEGASGVTERVVQVAWKLERVRGSVWALRNTGFAKARDALLSDATVPPKFVRPDEVIPRDVDRDDVLQFRVTAGRGAPPPRIRVTWREGAGSPAYSREFTVLAAS